MSVIAEVVKEFVRQEELWGEQNHPNGTGGYGYEIDRDNARDACNQAAEDGKLTWRHILNEEFREAVAESDPKKLREELIQVAAVCVNWVEAIDRKGV